MRRTNSLGVRLLPWVKAGLEKAAAADRRSLSSKVEMILADWLTANGYGESPAPAKSAPKARRS